MLQHRMNVILGPRADFQDDDPCVRFRRIVADIAEIHVYGKQNSLMCDSKSEYLFIRLSSQPGFLDRDRA
jgi:hypothetical protein